MENKIRFKGIQDEITEDAPFVGARISANGCKFNCFGCFNRGLLVSMPEVKLSAEEIIAIVKRNPFNQGIILAGGEWSEQAVDMLEIIEVAVANNLQVMIYTGCVLEQFHARVGKALVKAKKMEKMIGAVHGAVDELVYTHIGSQALDFLMPTDYYIKCGVYKHDELVDDNIQFGIKLASSNQKIYKISKESEEENEG